VLGGVTRVTIDPATLLTQSTAAMLVQGLSMQEIVYHFAQVQAVNNFMSNILGGTGAQNSGASQGVSVDITLRESAFGGSYVLGAAASQPLMSGASIYGDGNYDYWTESLTV